MLQSVLITGATGFIGRKLAEHLLNAQYKVHILVRPESNIPKSLGQARVHRCVNNVEQITEIIHVCKPDIVFHLASLYLNEHRPDQIDDLVKSNVLFPAQLMEAMIAAGAFNLVTTGTAWQHFSGVNYEPVNLYAATKQAGQDIADYYASVHGLSIITLKLFDTYGPNDNRRKLIKILSDAIIAGDPLDMSPGDQTVDLTHVDDVIEAFVTAGRLAFEGSRGMNQRFFVSGERLTIKSLVSVVASALDQTAHVRFGGRPYRNREVMEPYTPTASEILPRWKRSRSIKGSVRAISEHKAH